jgi:hypothetical protein
MKVYAVSSGDYSDYRIDAVYSTKERAEAFINGATTTYDIEEWELDQDPRIAVRMRGVETDVST